MTKQEADEKILQYKERIYGFALSKTRDYEQAQELAQEIICEVFISFLKSDNIVNYDGYVYRIASNVCSKFIGGLIQGRKLTCIEESPIAVNDRYFYEDNQQEIDTLKKEIGYLSQRQRDVVYLYYYGQKTVAEIAEQLEISSNTVKWHLSDARQTLKETIIMNEKKISKNDNLDINPIKFDFMGSSGTIVAKETKDFFDTRLKQNIAWACYKKTKTIAEISRAVGVSSAYVVDELQTLVDNGFINQVDNSKNPKYQSMIVISDLRQPVANKEKLYDVNDCIYTEASRKLCTDYYAPIFKDFEGDVNHWGMSCPDNDINFMKYSLVLLCQKFLQDETVNIEMEKLKIMRPDGGNYIANATIMNEWQDMNESKFPNWIMGYMMNWGDDFYCLQANCRFTDRSMDWREQTCYETMVKFIKADCNPDALKLEEYETLMKLGYIHKNVVQLILMNGGNKCPWEQIESHMIKYENTIKLLNEYGKLIDDIAKRPILESDEPEYAKKFKLLLQTSRIGSQEMIPYILDEMLKNGMLKPLTDVQKKAALTVLSI